MTKQYFGFSVLEQRSVNLDSEMPAELESLYQKEPSLRACIACGNCAAVCSAGHFAEMQFYRLNVMARRGLLHEMVGKAAACMLCGRCQMSCLRGVNIRHAVLMMSQL